MKTEQAHTREADWELYIALGMQPQLERGAHQDEEVRQGEKCPKCKAGRLAYDGLLNLSCPECGYAMGGCFT